MTFTDSRRAPRSPFNRSFALPLGSRTQLAAALSQGAGNPTPRSGLPPAGRMVTACIRSGPGGIMIIAMTAMNYIETELPEGMVLAEWRRAKAAARRKVRRTPRWRLRLA